MIVFSKKNFGELLHFWPLLLALAATAGFVWFAASLALEVTVYNGISATRWAHFRSGAPNEMGDTLAGFIGSLTLIWVVASVIQQSIELKAQRQEFSEMASAQSAQVEALEEQARIFRDEGRQRREREKGETLSEVCFTIEDLIKKAVKENFLISMLFDLREPELKDFNSGTALQKELNDRNAILSSRVGLDVFFADFLLRMRPTAVNLFLSFARAKPNEDVGRLLNRLIELFDRIRQIREELSEADVLRLERAQTLRFGDKIAEISAQMAIADEAHKESAAGQ